MTHRDVRCPTFDVRAASEPNRRTSDIGYRISLLAVCVVGLLAAGRPAEAQVQLVPTSVLPASWERFALRVINQADTPTVAVRIDLPDAVQVLGLEASPGWNGRLVAATDSSPQAIQWLGGRVERATFVELAFLARLAPDARPGETLVLPVQLTRADGTTRDWREGGQAPAPVVTIGSAAKVSASGAFAIAAGALGVAVLALGLSLARRR